MDWVLSAFDGLRGAAEFGYTLPARVVTGWTEHGLQIVVAACYLMVGYVGYKSLPWLANRYAVGRRDEAAAAGEVRAAGLEAARVLATGGVSLEPARLASAVSAARIDPDWGVWLSFVVSEHTDAVISGRNIEPVVSAVVAEYPDAQVEWIDDPAEIFAAPDLADALADPAGDGRGLPPGENELANVYRVYELSGQTPVGTTTIEEQASAVGRDQDPIEPAVVSVEDAVEPARGEWAEVGLHLRPAPKGSVKDLKARHLDYCEEVGTAQGGGTRLARWLVGCVMWFAGARSHAVRTWTGGSGSGSNNGRYRDTEESKQVKERAKSRRHFSVRPVARGRVREGREEQLERAFDSFFGRVEKPGGATLESKRRPAVYETRPETELKLAGPRPPGGHEEPVLTASEAAALWHPLGAGANTRRTRRSYLKTIPPSPRLPKQGPFLAKTNHPGTKMDLRFDLRVLPSHVRFLGVPGTGKSTLQYQAAEAILRSPGENHEKMGMVLLDPKYSLYQAVLENFPDSRDDDVIVLNAASGMPMPGYNLLIPEPGLDAEAVSETLVEILETRWPQGFGARMRPIMIRSIKTLVYANVEAIEDGEGPLFNLSHLSRAYFFALPEEDGIPPEFRAEVLGRLHRANARYKAGTGPYDQLLKDWEAFEALGGKKQEEYTQPITNKIDALFSSASIRRLFGVNHKDFTFKEVLEDGRVVLFNLAKSVYRGSTGYIVGTIFLSLLLDAAISRYGAAHERGEQNKLRECVMFIDEVQNFLCPQMTDIINEGRAYKIPMVVAHQETSQIGSDELKEAMEAAKTKVYFKTTLADGAQAAKRIGGEFTAELMSKMPDFNFVYLTDGGLQVTATTVPIPANPEGSDVAADVAEIASENWASPDKQPTPVLITDDSVIDVEDKAGSEGSGEGWFYGGYPDREEETYAADADRLGIDDDQSLNSDALPAGEDAAAGEPGSSPGLPGEFQDESGEAHADGGGVDQVVDREGWSADDDYDDYSAVEAMLGERSWEDLHQGSENGSQADTAGTPADRSSGEPDDEPDVECEQGADGEQLGEPVSDDWGPEDPEESEPGVGPHDQIRGAETQAAHEAGDAPEATDQDRDGHGNDGNDGSDASSGSDADGDEDPDEGHEGSSGSGNGGRFI